MSMKKQNDIRFELNQAIQALFDKDSEILLIGAPAFFRDFTTSPTINPNSQGALSSRAGRTLMGDQDHEPYHGIFQIGNYLNQVGISCKVIDMNIFYFVRSINTKFDPIETLDKILQTNKPSIVGISAMRPNLSEALQIAHRVKEKLNGTCVVLGGPATADPNSCTNDSVDFVLNCGSVVEAGEALRAILSPVTSTIAKIGGNPEIRKSNQTYIPPDYSSIPAEVPLVPRVFTSHGCSAGCGFCAPAALLDYKVSFYQPAESIQCIKQLHQDYDFQYFLIGDLTFYINTKPVKSLLDRLKDIDPKPWWCQTQAKYISQENARHLASAGCSQVAIGVEGFETNDFAIRRKNSGLEQTISALSALKESGISTQTYWIFGLPDDNENSARSRVKAIEHLLELQLIDSVHLSYLMPYPGTPLGDSPHKNNLVVKNTFEQHYKNTRFDFYDALPIHENSVLTREQIFDFFNEARRAAQSMTN